MLNVALLTFRSGTQEDYNELSQLLEGIISFRRDFAEQKEIEKEQKRKKEEDDRNKGEVMKNAAMTRMGSK
jgi:hypothetical protein